MKIQVVREDGNIETIHLIGTIKINENNDDGQATLTIESTGTSHFFRAVDGAYDGWGMEVAEVDGGLDRESAARFIQAVEHSRQVRKPGQKPTEINGEAA